MRLTDQVRRAGRSLGSAKGRTLLTSLAIAVGAFTLTLTMAASEGANQYAAKLIQSNFDPAELLVAKDFSIFGKDTSGFDAPQEYDESAAQQGGITLKRLTADDLATIAKMDGIERVRPQYQLQPQFVSTDKADAKRYSVSINAYSPGQKPEINAGALPDGSRDLVSGTVVIPESYVSVLGFRDKQSAVGQTIVVQLRRSVAINPAELQRMVLTQGVSSLSQLQSYETERHTFRIAAVIKKSATALTTSSALFVGSDDARSMNDYMTKGTDDYQKHTVAYVGVTNGTDKVVRDKAQKTLVDKGYNVQSVEDTQQFLTQIITILQGIVTGFGVIAIIASVFGIINTQYISVLERTQQIGLMKALGMRGRDVSRLFQLEAAWIGFLGGVIGSGIAAAAGIAMNPWITEKLGLGEGTSLLIFQPLPIAGLIIVLILVAMLAGWFPARKAAKLDPIDALRTE